jgi:hypothetical protein
VYGLENIRDILEQLENRKEIKHNPFASIPNQRLRDALSFLEETAAEIIPLPDKE